MFPWYPKPVRNLASCPGSINSVPTVLAFCETQNAISHKAVETGMTPIAERYISEAKEGEPAIAFTIVTSSEGLAPRLRSMFSMPTLPPKTGKAIEPLPTRLVLCDFPDQGGYYLGSELSDTQSFGATVDKFVKGDHEKALERSQLS